MGKKNIARWFDGVSFRVSVVGVCGGVVRCGGAI
jgi:hypothetical protein